MYGTYQFNASVQGTGCYWKHGSKIEFESASFIFDSVAAMNTNTSNVCVCVNVVMVLTW